MIHSAYFKKSKNADTKKIICGVYEENILLKSIKVCLKFYVGYFSLNNTSHLDIEFEIDSNEWRHYLRVFNVIQHKREPTYSKYSS